VSVEVGKDWFGTEWIRRAKGGKSTINKRGSTSSKNKNKGCAGPSLKKKERDMGRTGGEKPTMKEGTC